MDSLTHFRGHTCTETNTHTQHEGILSLYVHLYANVCMRACVLLCVYMHVQVYTIICTCIHTMLYMHTLTITSPASRRLRAAILEAWLQNFSSNTVAMKKCTSVLPSL